MNSTCFAFKRIHLISLSWGREMTSLYGHGLTPARYDMLAVIFTRTGLAQRDLQDALGVCAMTVSRMIRSLEDIGLVARRRMKDARCYWVTLTPKGEDVASSFTFWHVFSGVTLEPFLPPHHNPRYCDPCAKDLHRWEDDFASRPTCREARRARRAVDLLTQWLHDIRHGPGWRDFANVDFDAAVRRAAAIRAPD